MSSKQSFKGKHLAAIGCNSYIPLPCPNVISQWQYLGSYMASVLCHRGGGARSGVGKDLFGCFCLSERLGLLTAFLETVKGTEYIILSRPNHSYIFQNHPILVAAPSLQKPHYKHDESRRANICPGGDLAVEEKMGLGIHLLRTGEVALELDDWLSATHSLLPSTHLALTAQSEGWAQAFEYTFTVTVSIIQQERTDANYILGNHAQNIKWELNLGISLYSNWLEALLLQIKNLRSPRSRKLKGKLCVVVTVGASSQVGERGGSCLDTPGTGSFLCSPLLYDLECFLGYSSLKMGVPIVPNLESPTRLRLQCHTQCACTWRSMKVTRLFSTIAENSAFWPAGT